jgi:hypothetical protein
MYYIKTHYKRATIFDINAFISLDEPYLFVRYVCYLDYTMLKNRFYKVKIY